MGLRSRAFEVAKPLIFIAVGTVTFGVTILDRLLALDFGTLLSVPKFRKRWFNWTWKVISGPSYRNAKPNVAPMVEQAQGRVLDIGTGTGSFLVHYDPSKVTKVFAVETNRGQHEGLLAKAKEAKLDDRFEAFDKPLEHLRDQSDLHYGSIDTVVTLQVLCSVDDPEGLTKELYKYLKPGGRWIVYEHVYAPSGYPYWVQSLLNVVWPYMFDGCNLCRDTKRTLEAAGKWQTLQVERMPEDPPGCIIPHIRGFLYKA